MTEPGQHRASPVIHVTFGLDVGGQEKLLLEMARHLDRGRFSQVFVSLGERGALAADVEACGWPVVALGLARGLRPVLVARLARLFRQIEPAVVHTHDHRALFYGGPAAWIARVPWIVNTRHGRNVHFTSRQVAVGKHLARLVDRYVCVSDDVKAQCIDQGLPGLRLQTIQNGIDVERFALSGPCPTGPVVAVARLSPEKDLANLVRAAALAREAAPDLRVEIAGGGPCLAELEGLVAELGLAEHVRLLGEVRDVAAVLARARMFVLPSRSEGIPLTVLEAMARGLPVVATRVGGVPEVVAEGQTGLLVGPGDSSALAAAMLSVWNEPERGAAMGREGRRQVVARFDVRRMVAAYESLYLEGPGRRSRRRRDAETRLQQAGRPRAAGPAGTGVS